MIDSLKIHQNADGGWPYKPGGSSWTEPTVYVLLAGYSAGDASGRDKGIAWLRRRQRSDGGWAPKPGVAQSTWVTALAALIPAEDIGEPEHQRAIRWLLELTAANATYMARIRAWLSREKNSDPNAGWPWFPGTAAWVTPTAIATLALAKENRRRPDASVRDRVSSGRRFLLAHRCADGGWNHGAANALGVNAQSYPETTGAALLALYGADAAALRPSVRRAEEWWKDCQSAEGASWLMLGLRANGCPQAGIPERYKPRTIQDAALCAIAAAGDSGTGVFTA
jgi:hypothetical protein